MKKTMMALALLAAMGCVAAERTTPIYNGVLIGPMNAGGNMITNLPNAFWEGHEVKTNAVNDLIATYDETNLTARIDAKVGLNSITNIVTNVVTKTYVEGLGISGGGGANTNVVEDLIAKYDATNLAARICAKMDAVDLAGTNALTSGITSSKVATYDGYGTGKQDTLVSGTNIKTINHTSLLGSGNITIGGSGGDRIVDDYNIITASGVWMTKVSATEWVTNEIRKVGDYAVYGRSDTISWDGITQPTDDDYRIPEGNKPYYDSELLLYCINGELYNEGEWYPDFVWFTCPTQPSELVDGTTYLFYDNFGYGSSCQATYHAGGWRVTGYITTNGYTVAEANAATMNLVTNIVTKTYVESLGISGGGITTNDVNGIIASSNLVDVASATAMTNALRGEVSAGYVPFVEDVDGNKTAVTIGLREGNVGVYSFVNGADCEASVEYSHAEGYITTASGEYSHAEGSDTTASGEYSHAEGSDTTASGEYSHAEGYDTTASGFGSHAEGESATASGDDSHAEGYNTTASGEYSHAEGSDTTASGDRSHAEGYNTTASGDGSHADGVFSETMSEDKYSFAWSGDEKYDEEEVPIYYQSHGVGTFNINPVGGTSGFWIGEKSLAGHLSAFAPKLTGRTYDFANGSNFTLRLYAALTNVIQSLGGSVTNAPAFN